MKRDSALSSWAGTWYWGNDIIAGAGNLTD